MNTSKNILATDLDGTLIPLSGNAQHREDLVALSALLQQHASTLIFATGRHFESVLDVMDTAALPQPEWIICDVGTSLYRQNGSQYVLYQQYTDELNAMTQGVEHEAVETLLADCMGLTLQPQENQGIFKVSYFCAQAGVDRLAAEINARLQRAGLPYACLGSVDPFVEQGLLDVLPATVNKAYALTWLATHVGYVENNVIYAGDSGNDLAALTAGFKSIIVGNASVELMAKVKDILGQDRAQSHLYCARSTATSGVLEGCKHYL